MRSAICAVFVERREGRLYYLKDNGITRFYYENLSERCEEAKLISI
jgi:hypothetical protein